MFDAIREQADRPTQLVKLSELFAPDRDTLVLYSSMFGPDAKPPCPSDRGQDPRHIDMFWPLWNVLDVTPDGRGTGWYPSLTYT